MRSSFLRRHGDGAGDCPGFGSGGAPFPLPPPRHLLLPHTWPGAADAASAAVRDAPATRWRVCAPQPASLLPGDSSEPRQIFRARLPLDRLLSSPPGPHHENLIPNAFVARHGKKDGGESRTLLRPGAGGAPGKALVWGASGFEGHRRVGVPPKGWNWDRLAGRGLSGWGQILGPEWKPQLGQA